MTVVSRRTRRALGCRWLAAFGACALALAAIPATSSVAADSHFSLNLFGLSHHPDRQAARAARLDSEFNPGLGIRWQRSVEWDGRRDVLMAEADLYRDSGRTRAFAAGLGYQLRPWNGPLRLGAALVLFDSRSYNRGEPFLTPLPMATLELGPVELNVTYAPKIGRLNDVATYGFYLTLPLR